MLLSRKTKASKIPGTSNKGFHYFIYSLVTATPGEYSAKVPIILNGNIERPYQYLHLYGILHAPKLTFDPLAIVMTPVPLSTSTSTDLTIYAHGFTR